MPKTVFRVPKKGLIRQTSQITAAASGFAGAACMEATQGIYSRIGGSVQTDETCEIEAPAEELETETEPGD